jgi:SAM-dependent methyltransferase
VTIEPVAYEPRRFRTAAAHYLAGRAPYPPALLARVAQITGVTTAHRVMDLGCGPAQLARGFAAYARDVLGVDPEPEMLRLARAEAPANVGFIEASSYDLGPALGRFQLVTIGRAFHWMDRVDTLRRLDALVEPGGAIALFSDTHVELPENAWRQAFRDLINRYAANDASRTQRQGPNWIPHFAVLLDSPFSELEQISVFYRREVTAAMLIDQALSMSSTSRAFIGDRADELVAELTDWFGRIAPSGVAREVIAGIALIARRPDRR